MDAVIGVCGADFALLLADRGALRSIIRFHDTEDKIYEIGHVGKSTKLLACAGPTSDRTNFCEYVQANVKLYNLRTGVPLTTHAIANFTRNELATAIRKGPYQANLLLGGFDEGKGASLFYIDYMGTLHQVDKAAHGYGSNFTLSILDRFCFKSMTLDDAKDVLRKCIAELQVRFLINMPSFMIKLVDKDGVREISL